MTPQAQAQSPGESSPAPDGGLPARSAPSMEFVILRYEYVDGYLEAREPHRAAHLELARAAAQRGVLRYGGAIEGEHGWEAMLIFDTDAPQVAADFVAQDPFVQHGVVLQHRIERWPVVVGFGLEHR